MHSASAAQAERPDLWGMWCDEWSAGPWPRLSHSRSGTPAYFSNLASAGDPAPRPARYAEVRKIYAARCLGMPGLGHRRGSLQFCEQDKESDDACNVVVSAINISISTKQK